MQHSNAQHPHSSYYDAIVIGGGIQGCGCAQAIAAAGYSVLLVEQNELASGTSSRSSKLIHGGLRYLETGQFSLVRKSLNERALLTRLAPSLVKLKPFYLPVYRSARLGRLKLGAGLTLYSLLGNLRSDSRFSLVPKSRWAQLGGLKQQQLQCVYRYYDAQTDDALLTRAVGRSAVELGASVQEHCTFVTARKSAQDPNMLEVELRTESGHTSLVHSRVIINAAGPWASEVQRKIAFAGAGPQIDLVQGSHIELDQSIVDAIFYVESPIDARPVFIMPWPGGTLVGTTETEHSGKPEQSAPTEGETGYLLQTLKHYFPEFNGQITRSWSGLRVLPQDQAASDSGKVLRPFSKRTRDTIIHLDNNLSPAVISLYGGKLTAYRTTAAAVAEIAGQALLSRGVTPARAALDTAEIPL